MISSKRNLIVLGFLIAICFSLIFFLIGYFGFRDPKLGTFTVLEVIELKDKQFVTFEKSKNATNYLISVIDKYDNTLYEAESNTNSAELPNLNLNYQEEVYIKVKALNKNGKTKDARNLYTYEHSYASFSEENTFHMVDNEDKTLILDGEVDGNYSIEVVYRNEIIYKNDIDYNEVTVSHAAIEPYSGKLTARLYHNNLLVNTMNLYHNATIVSDIKINNIEANAVRLWNDLELKYDGGVNATSFYVNVYIGRKFVDRIEGDRYKTVIPASTFKENTSYTFEVVAMYEDYYDIAKVDNVKIFISEKEVVNPVFVNYNPGTIKPGTEVTLASKTKNSNIYYTTDGTNPSIYGILYTEPITIDKNITIKAIATKENCLNSEANTYDFVIRDKIPVIYLSPSNQYLNFGVKSVGYTNEQEFMNKVANVVERELKNAGVKVYRNTNLRDGMKVWLQKSRSVGSDLHFAIHSNGSTNHTSKGMEIYVNEPTSPGLSIANVLYDNLYAIYPYNNDPITNRGVKFARGSLGEVNPLNIKTGVLLEIAHHDYKDDAKWIVDNIEEIGINLANTIIEFYQVGEE